MKLHKLIITGLLTVSFATCLSAKPGEDSDKPRPPKRSFEEVDTNQDGKVSLAEFVVGVKNEERATKHFNRKDKDQDGSLTEEEFTAKGKKGKGKKGKGKKGKGKGGSKKDKGGE